LTGGPLFAKFGSTDQGGDDAEAAIVDDDRLIGLIYEGVIDDAPWNCALSRVANAVGAVGVGLGMQDMQTHEFRSPGAFGIDLDLNPTYRRPAPDNRIWQEIGRPREPLTDRMVMPKAALLRTERQSGEVQGRAFEKRNEKALGLRGVASLTRGAGALNLGRRRRRRPGRRPVERATPVGPKPAAAGARRRRVVRRWRAHHPDLSGWRRRGKRRSA
jgi:hypothetical protein